MQRAREGLAALCLVDVDNFKAYNDLHGHQGGDEALKGVAATLQQPLRRSGDPLYRVGGEESASCCAPMMPRPPWRTSTQVLSAGFGVQWPSGTRDLRPGDIYKAADDMLYRAKAAGRNQVLARALAAAQASPGSRLLGR
jgi:PleD family two-component response regulator